MTGLPAKIVAIHKALAKAELPHAFVWCAGVACVGMSLVTPIN